MFDLLLKLPEFMHQVGNLGHSIVVKEHSVEGSPAILILVFLEIFYTLMTLAADQGIEQALYISIISNVVGELAEAVLDSVITALLFD